jgi:oligopeptide transport system substrate-binding protein
MKCMSLLLSIVAMAFITSCTSESESKKEIRLYLQAEPFSLDPRKGGDRRSQVLLREMFEGLTRLGKSGTPELAMAHAVTISDDKMVYTFLLRPARWSNGLEVTAHDFVWAWKGALDPSFGTSFCYAFFVIKNAKKAHANECPLESVGIRAINAKTLEVTLEHPTPYFLELTANPLYSPLCKAATKDISNWAASTFPSYVSNGPFILKEHVFKSHITLERNPSYWDKDSVKNAVLSFPIVEDPTTAYTLFQKGELDWYGDPCGLIPLETLAELQPSLIKKKSGGLYWLVTCTEKPSLASAKIRRALASAINRRELVHFINGGEEPAFSVLPPFMTMLDTPPFKDGDVGEAQKLFREGCEELGYTTETYPHLSITHWAEPVSKIIAEAVHQQIEHALGIKVDLVGLDWGTYMKKVPAGDIDIATAPWFSWVEDPMYNLNYLKFKKNGINGTCWENEEYIHQLNEAESCIDTLKRQRYMQQAEHIAMQELPLIPLYYTTYKYAKTPKVHGEVISPVGTVELKWLEKTRSTE